MTRKDKHSEEVALFRFRVIGELLHLVRGSREYREEMSRLTGKPWAIPGSDRTRVARQTICDWLQMYDPQRGVDSLRPKIRSDWGQRRKMSVGTMELLMGIKRRSPKLSVRQVIETARRTGEVPEGDSLAPTTVYSLLRSEGLMDRQKEGQVHDRRRFSYANAGELWMSDVMHGPRAADGKGSKRKTYMIALLDDATRVVPHAEFAFSESEVAFILALREGILRRGIPCRLYVDNGACYRSRQLQRITVNLGINLIHATARAPQGKGKIERFIRTVRQQFLPQVEEADAASLEALNKRLRTWIEGEYHHSPHRGLDGRTPLSRWLETADKVRLSASIDRIEDLFLFQASRKVRQDCTVSLACRSYEVDSVLAGRTVTLLYDPTAPDRPVKVVYDGRSYEPGHLVDPVGNAQARRRPRKPGIRFGNPFAAKES